jgi:hypothetical protein
LACRSTLAPLYRLGVRPPDTTGETSDLDHDTHPDEEDGS